MRTMLRGFWAVALMSLRTFWRDRNALFWGVAFPLMLMGLIGSVFGGSDSLQLTTSVVRPATPDPISARIVTALRSIPTLKVIEEDEASGRAALLKGDRSLLVIIPSLTDLPALAAGAASAALIPGSMGPTGPTEPAAATVPVKVYYDQGHQQVAQAGVAIIQAVVSQVNQQLTGRWDRLAVAAEGLSSGERQLTMFDFLLPGMLAMTIMSNGLMGVTWVVSTYRERHVLKRVLATPFSPVAFLAGLVARFTITNLVQSAIIVALGVLIFRAQVVGSFLNLAILALLGSATFLTVGFAISTFARSPEGASNLGNALSFPMMFLSGTFWPKEMIPAALQPVVKALPLTPLVDALRGVSTQADGLSAHLWGIGYLALWMVAALAIGAWRFRWE